MNRLAEKFRGPGFRDCSLRQGTKTRAVKPRGSPAGYGLRLLVWRTSPSAPSKFTEQLSKARRAEDSKILVAIGKGVDADAENARQIKELTSQPMDLCCRPISAWTVSVGTRNTLAKRRAAFSTFTFVAGSRVMWPSSCARVRRRRSPQPSWSTTTADAIPLPLAAHPGCKPVDLREAHRQNLDPALFQEIDRARDRTKTEIPVDSHAQSSLLCFSRIAQCRPGAWRGMSRATVGRPRMSSTARYRSSKCRTLVSTCAPPCGDWWLHSDNHDRIRTTIRMMDSPGPSYVCNHGTSPHDLVGVPTHLGDLRYGAPIGDKAFDAKWLIEEIEASGAMVVMPARRRRAVPRHHDREMHKWRHQIDSIITKNKGVTDSGNALRQDRCQLRRGDSSGGRSDCGNMIVNRP